MRRLLLVAAMGLVQVNAQAWHGVEAMGLHTPTSLADLLDGGAAAWDTRSSVAAGNESALSDAARLSSKASRVATLRLKINTVFFGPSSATYDTHGFDAITAKRVAEALSGFIVEEVR